MSLPPQRRRAVAIGLLVAALAMVVRFPGALPGPDVVSAHDHLSVHPLFQSGSDRGRVAHPHLSDPALQLAALDRRTIEALRAGRAPLWNPDLYGGAPLLGDGQSRPLSPVTWIRALLPTWPGVAQDLGVAWLFAWLSVGVALLTDRLFPGARWPVATASAAAVTTPYLSVWLLHPHASTFVWLPWCLYALEAGSLPLMALAAAGLWSGGHPGTVAHVGVCCAAWWLCRSRQWKGLVGALAGTLLAAPAWAPLWEQIGRSTTVTARVGGALDPSLLLDLLWPGYWGHPATETWHGAGAWADGQLHPGLGAMLLGVAGVFGMRRTRHARLLQALVVAMTLATVASVTGLPGPVAHGRLGSLAAIGWCLLAAGGALVWMRTRPGTAALAPILVLTTGTWARWSDQHTLSASEHARSAAPWVAPVRAAAGDGRILGVGWAAQPNTGALAGLRDLRGYDLPLSTDTHRLMSALSSRPRGPWYPVDSLPPASLLEWWNVRVLLAFPEDADAVSSWAEAAGWDPLPLANDAPLAAWVDPTPGPSAWLASATVSVQQPEQGLQWIARSSASRHTVPVTDSSVRLQSAEASITPANRHWDGGSRMTMNWTPRADETLLVVAEAWAPGWRARLGDGTAVAPVRVAGAAIGIPIPAGERSAVLYYRPDGWIQGQRLFGAGCVLLLLGLILPRLRRPALPSDDTIHG